MSLRQLREVPEKCPECQSENLGGLPILQQDEGNLVLCNACGIWMVIQEEYEEETEEPAYVGVGASFVVCPHCTTVDEIQIYGDAEYCSGCGLDPSRDDYGSADLAHLWKQGSDIRNFMEGGRPPKTMRMFRFLTSECGPHCTQENECPQNTISFIHCHKLVGGQESMGKKRSKRERKAERKRRQREQQQVKSASLVRFAPLGWYAKKLEYKSNDEIGNPQGSTNTGGGSGT